MRLLFAIILLFILAGLAPKDSPLYWVLASALLIFCAIGGACSDAHKETDQESEEKAKEQALKGIPEEYRTDVVGDYMRELDG